MPVESIVSVCGGRVWACKESRMRQRVRFRPRSQVRYKLTLADREYDSVPHGREKAACAQSETGAYGRRRIFEVHVENNTCTFGVSSARVKEASVGCV